MSWWQRIREGITTSTREKKEAPDGIWYKCPNCKATLTIKDLHANLHVCTQCGYHDRINSFEYFHLIFDKEPQILFDELVSVDHLNFTDLKSYKDRIKETYEKTNLKDAMQVAVGKVSEHDLVVACMDFDFIGGSMGSVVGEKISRSIDYCMEHEIPLLIISKSGGARMMESAYSLMQLAKTSAKLTLLADAKIPFISLLTDPTTGGVTASFAMLGDFIIAEPGALIGFAGPRVIKETIKKDLPEGFQRSEFLLEKGFIDFIVPRSELKQKLSALLTLLKH
jgi:acetyl-CoA carboxylase carboxyl transferase subunit beta